MASTNAPVIVNSSVIVSDEKTGNTSTGTTLSMLGIYSR